jgi:hypothetical protein
MTTAALITKLKKKLEKETDANVLKAIEILLKDDTKAARIRRRMMEGALRSEEDIAEGRVMSAAEAKRRLQEHIASRRKEKEKKAKRA